MARIKNYIINAYNTWNPAPAYVLLVGSPDFIRSEQNQFDDYYANMAGNYLMELSVGRFSCATARQCSLMVAKTLGYEQTPFLADTNWYKKGTGIIREDIALSDSIYWQNMRYIFGLWQGAGYTGMDSFSRLNNDSARHVEQVISNGRSYVVYRGQGVNNWWDPFAINPDLTNNGYKLPVIISGTCATISLEPSISYLGEACLRAGTRASPKGANAFFGTTNSTSGTGIGILRGTVATSFFRALFGEQIYKLGDACRRAKFLIDSLRPAGYISTRYREWNLLGDPELNLWTGTPKTLFVQCETVIPTGTQNYTVSVSQGTNPLVNALVCIIKDSSVYEYAYTNTFGAVSFSINPQTDGFMTVTVTAQNCIPSQKTIRITSSSIVEGENRKIKIENYTIYPNPARSFFVIDGRLSADWVKLFDMQGRQIAIEKSEIRNPKSKVNPKPQNSKLLVDINKLNRGVYMVSVRTTGQEIFQKLVKY